MSKVLIVDDMREVYEKIQGNFKDSDYSPSVDDALRKIRDGEYDRIITDYHLGEDSPKGGLEVTREASKKGIEVILMSTENHEKEALDAGATKFVFKRELLTENATG